VAEYNGTIIGTGGMAVWRIRNGIGTRLLNKLIKEARPLGLKYLHLHSSEDGMNMYRKAGFTEPHQIELRLRLE